MVEYAHSGRYILKNDPERLLDTLVRALGKGVRVFMLAENAGSLLAKFVGRQKFRPAVEAYFAVPEWLESSSIEELELKLAITV